MELPKKKLILYSFCTLAISLVIIFAGLNLISYFIAGKSPVDLVKQLEPPKRIGLWQDDPDLGWVNIPSSTVNYVMDASHSAIYNIDAQGNRVTPASYDKPKVLILGCSFTFGDGVQDNETYPYRLQTEFPDYKIINAATMAWGTGQALIQLEKNLARQKEIKLVVYGFIYRHLHRNYLRKYWLEGLAHGPAPRRNVHFEIENNELGLPSVAFKGLADPERDGLEDSRQLAIMEGKITQLMLEKMKQLAQAQGIPFIVMYLPDSSTSQFSEKIADIVGPDFYFDLRNQWSSREIVSADNFHPSPSGHEKIAEFMRPILRKFLANPPL